ncbi:MULTISPECIES: AI-2E family transporter [Ectothiorhodospira]|uniref:AI-2E family transporter n=1 Tax=Ectothiorhodospira TaxID=1051 RepID=UPI001EE8F788|nr:MULTISPECIES: AI-2E family transporter [Ectothiorhodospira]MCG5493627.1 AI-2E family transporter [Ectothiorhodospira variabilis]MCG5502956.1 AI-2E family transporter [Ectothiorhodospira variabilis]MCG5506256.1 AI-2E family transporter [Ectothiorhodospira variabilis]MCG5525118.1 AI-2E family transporter [Ectothiorhodospira haloalkaliphila]
MFTLLREWYSRHFSNPQVFVLAAFLVMGLVVLVLAGQLLAPLLAAVIIAYLLEWAVHALEQRGLPRLLAVTLCFVLFLGVMLGVVLVVVPILMQQIGQLVRELPRMILEGQRMLLQLPENYPHMVTEDQVREVMGALRAQSIVLGQRVLNLTLMSAMQMINLLVYLIIVPLMVFFLLKDKALILAWFASFLPRDSGLVQVVWQEVHVRISSYVRGKFIEIVIVWGVTYLVFWILGLNYALLISLVVGLSVLIPLVGAIAVTLPVALVAYFQWGFSAPFIHVMLAYTVIQMLDGNVLVPLLFSEMMNLHPLAIIVAVIIFGGLWGLWGVFFAIPLATLVNAVIRAWPSGEVLEQSSQPCHQNTISS